MKVIKKMNEFISSTSYRKLFSMVELSKGDVFYKIFYTPLKNKIAFIETTSGKNEKLPFEKGDDIQKVFDWVNTNDDVEIVKIRRKK